MSSPIQTESPIIQNIPEGSSFRLGIVVAEWNREITEKLEQGALKILNQSGVKPESLYHITVPGSFELVAGAQIILENRGVDAVICIGAVIRGETPHFDYICGAVSTGIIGLTLKYNKPIIFGVLTTDNIGQAEDRSGGKFGNKGEEAASTALKMILIKNNLLRAKNSPLGFV